MPAWQDRPKVIERPRTALVSAEAVTQRALKEVPNQILKMEQAAQRAAVTRVGRPVESQPFRCALDRWRSIWSDLMQRFYPKEQALDVAISRHGFPTLEELEDEILYLAHMREPWELDHRRVLEKDILTNAEQRRCCPCADKHLRFLLQDCQASSKLHISSQSEDEARVCKKL